jgi:hypothetical protein
VYETLLGESWYTLHPAIRTFHEPSARVRRAGGKFRIHAAASIAARGVARLARMPPPADTVDVSVVVTTEPSGECWRRKFGAWPLESVQRIAGDLVAERFGAIEVRFRLEAADGALWYRFAGAALRLGILALPLPLLATASERAVGDSAIAVSVDVAMKAIGRIVAYEGTLTRIEVER